MFEHENNDQNEQRNETVQEETAASQENQELKACQEELGQWKERLSRVGADFENYKKRVEKERALWMQSAQHTLLHDIIGIVDDFDRAFASLESHEKEDERLKQWISGFSLIHQAFAKLLVKYHVQEMKDYKEFDPVKHEAVMQVESEQHESGKVVQVLQKGYMYKDQVLRPAKVSVAK